MIAARNLQNALARFTGRALPPAALVPLPAPKPEPKPDPNRDNS